MAIPILGKLLAAGNVFGNAASSARQGRYDDANLDTRMFTANNNARLQAAQHNIDTGSTRMGQVARADLLGNMQNAPLLGDPRIDKFAGGGLRPSAFGEATRTAANEQQRQAMLALMNRSDQVTPQIASLRKPGWLERIGSIAGLVSGMGTSMRSPQSSQPS